MARSAPMSALLLAALIGNRAALGAGSESHCAALPEPFLTASLVQRAEITRSVTALSPEQRAAVHGASGEGEPTEQPSSSTAAPSDTAAVWKIACAAVGCVALLSLVACLGRRLDSTSAASDATAPSRSSADAGASAPDGAGNGECAPAVGPQRGPRIPEAEARGGVVELFEAEALRRPRDRALVDCESGEAVSYGQLLELVRALASSLGKSGLGDGDVAGLLLEPSRHFVVATLGCMQAGVAWLPLDLKSPTARLRHLLDRAGARLAMVAEGIPPEVAAPVPVWALGKSGEVPSSAQQVPPRPPLTGTARAKGTAAVFFTSGSTGEPKAVRYGPDTICHGALCMAKLCKAGSESVFLVKTPVVWAVTEYEVFTPLVLGARAVVDPRAQRDVARLARTISHHGVSILVTSAPVLQLLSDEQLPTLTNVINVGAALPLEVCALARRGLGPGLAIHNLYGCTETPCVQWTYDPAAPCPPGVLAPAGLPQPGVEVQLLDGDLRPVPEGAAGEIYIGGPFLAQGYLGDERLTAERFTTGLRGAGRLYRTGDTGRWLREEGGRLALQVEGRVDRQLNIKGVRVAPEEVEAVLSQAPGIREVALVVLGDAGAERMVACAAGTGGDKPLQEEIATGDLTEALRKHSLENLPLHMRPAVVLLLPALPKLANGKVDYVSLHRRAAEEAPEEGEEEVNAVDSLGQMKKVKRQALHENRVMSAMRALAAIALVIYHWYWVRFAGFSHSVGDDMKADWQQQGPPLLLATVKGMFGVSDWSMVLFMTLQAYVDSREAAKSMVKQNVLALVLYLLCKWPFPQLMDAILQGPLQNSALRAGFSDGSHRWYLTYYIVCNCLHSCVFLPLRSASARAPPHVAVLTPIGALVCTGLVCWALTYDNGAVWQYPPLNACSTAAQLSPGAELLMRFLIVDVEPGKCPILRSMQAWLFFEYALAWWLGPPLVDYLRKGHLGRRLSWLGPLPWLAAFWAGVVGLGWGENCNDYTCLGATTTYLLRFLDPISGYLVILTVALASQRAWFPLSALSWLGNFTLAVYIFHCYFFTHWAGGSSMRFFSYNGTAIVPPPEQVVASVGEWPGSSLVKFVVLIAYVVIFTATCCALLQKVLLAGVSLGQKAAKSLTDGTTRGDVA